MSNKFIINRDDNNLKMRLDEYLQHTHALDVLVGYFYAQGFHIIKDKFDKTERIRILVGMGTDSEIVNQVSIGQTDLKLLSDSQIAEKAAQQIVASTEIASQSNKDFESLNSIMSFVKSKKLEVRAYRKQQLHAKLYLLHTKGIIDGAVITGSSNLTKSGLEDNLEINVLLTDKEEYIAGKELFDELWGDSVDISELLVDKIENETWLKPVDPAAIFYKAAYEFIGGTVGVLEPDDDDISTGRSNFIKLKYQDDAARQAVDVIRQYNGVFISDVVGLGKTIMGALVLRRMRNLGMRSTAIVICAPGLIKEWQDWTSDIGNGSIRVFSSGDLAKILQEIKEGTLKDHKVDTVLIDESHNFRNADSDTYGLLQEITNKKKVVLLSATPQTKSTWDLANQLKLFADQTDFMDLMEGKSVKVFFNQIDKLATTQEKAVKLDALMRAVMIRRTRSEIIKYYQDDIINQGLTFPSAADPEIILYELSEDYDGLLSKIESLIAKLKLPRFQPREFIKDEYTGDKTLTDLSKGGAQLKAINRILLFKRLESSIVAVRKTLKRQLEVNQKFIKEAEASGILPFGVDNLKLINADFDWFIDADGKSADDIAKHLNPNYLLEKFNYTDLKQQLVEDNATINELLALIAPITANNDSKLQKLITLIRNKLDGKKVLIFSESKETAEYLKQELEKSLNEEVGLAHGQIKSTEYEDLKKRFAPNANSGLPEGKSELRLLVATDTFSEGVNLQDANHVINYDLPWNPIRIIQRVGRVNRVGSKHNVAYSFNFFPSDEIDSHIGSNSDFAETLKKRVKRRIDEFQSIIGDDTKHLSPDEQPEPRKLFTMVTESTDKLEEDKSSKYSYSELVSMLRKLRQDDPAYYDYIVQTVPKKAWSARQDTNNKPHVVALAKRDKHIIFFDTLADGLPQVISPTKGFTLLDAGRIEKTYISRPPDFFGDTLRACENAFQQSDSQDMEYRQIASNSYEGKLKGLINDYYLPTLSADLRDNLNRYIIALKKEQISNRKAVKRAYIHCVPAQNATELLELLQEYLPLEVYITSTVKESSNVKPEILLSCIFQK